jgi:hypothetical protein
MGLVLTESASEPGRYQIEALMAVPTVVIKADGTSCEAKVPAAVDKKNDILFVVRIDDYLAYLRSLTAISTYPCW